MQSLDSDILLLKGPGSNTRQVAGVLSEGFCVSEMMLEDLTPEPIDEARLYVFIANLASQETYDLVKAATKLCQGEKLYVLPTHNKKSLLRLENLGVTSPFMLPLNEGEFMAAAKRALNRQAVSSWSELSEQESAALRASLTCFQDCFDRMRRGEPLPLDNIEETCLQVCESAKVGKLSDWIGGLQGHHDYSFRHSMFVCGSMTYFANSLGMSNADLQQLTVGGMIHDVGKSQVPLEILDKPGKLDDAEWAIMRTHPEHSREILLRESDMDPKTIAMAVHHHEKLDGGGYPDGLSGAQIPDWVRLTAICDVYSALVEKRSYKEPMTKEQALDLMGKFKGHLDMDLLRAFRTFVLDDG